MGLKINTREIQTSILFKKFSRKIFKENFGCRMFSTISFFTQLLRFDFILPKVSKKFYSLDK